MQFWIQFENEDYLHAIWILMT